MIWFSLEKTVALLVTPIGLIWLLMLAGGGLCLRRRQWRPAALVLGAALLYACAGNLSLAGHLAGALERRVPPVALAQLEPFDAICVLGGGSELDPSGAPELGSPGDRVFLAARLWHAGKARLLVASGVANGVSGLRDGGQETRALWRSVGIPERAILPVPEPCWNTRQEIQAYVRFQARYGWKRIGLLSSATHLPRAMALARRAGLLCTPLGADWVGRPRPFLFQDLVPQERGLEITQRACWEYLGRWLGR